MCGCSSMRKTNKRLIRSVRTHHPQLIIFDTDICNEEELYPAIDRIKEMLPESILILLLDESDTLRLRTFLQQRNERFLLKPVNEHNFIDIISSCLREITTIADDRDLIEKLTERMQRFRPQLENMLIHDIAVNRPVRADPAESEHTRLCVHGRGHRGRSHQ